MSSPLRRTAPGSADPGPGPAERLPAASGSADRREVPAMESLAETAPLIGRSGLVKDVVRCLRDDTRSGAIIVGGGGHRQDRGVTRRCSANWGHAGHLIRLTATPALAAVPFGALAPYLSGLPDRELDSYAAVVAGHGGQPQSRGGPAAVRHRRRPLPGPGDHGTAGPRRCGTGAADILATSRPGPLIPEEFLSLWDDGLLAKFELAPLSRAGSTSSANRSCGPTSRRGSVRCSHEAAEGNPLMLMSLIEHARRAAPWAPARSVVPPGQAPTWPPCRPPTSLTSSCAP